MQETLAVPWTTIHFHHYFYRHNVVVFTNHSAVKQSLLTQVNTHVGGPGTGVKKVGIVY